ncbi:MAG: PhoX family protein [Cyanobium sp.]
MNRRTLLFQILGVGGSGLLLSPRLAKSQAEGVHPLGPFPPLSMPLPLPTDGMDGATQRQVLSRTSLDDRLTVPEGFQADVLAVWGDSLAGGRFGFNNDYLAFFPQADGTALLTVNFEYISFRPWREALAEVLTNPPPVQKLIDALAPQEGRIDASSLPPDHPWLPMVMAVATAAIEDLGVGVISLERDHHGRWRRTTGTMDRRITGLSGLKDAQKRLHCSGPAAAVFRRRQRMGYDDGLGDRVIGTFANCAGGRTPWGTLLTAEENIQDQVVEAVHADGSSPPPSQRPFRCDEERLSGLGNPFGLAGNKYGWMVEVDPTHPNSPAVRHSWLGRFRHEAVAIRAVTGLPLQVYSGCDRHGGHLYRFVSQGIVSDPADPANSRLLEEGRLEVARFESPGSDGWGKGRWLPMDPSSPVDPALPSHLGQFGIKQPTLVPHGDRSRAGAEALVDDGAVNRYRSCYHTLADLYLGRGNEQMGAILIDAHLAANAIGATPTARPEDTELDPRSGALLIAFTAAGRDEEGCFDPAIFRGPSGEATWPHSWVIRLEDSIHGGNRGFRWRMVATGGTPWQGGMGFANPDNLAFDRSGNLWMLTDRSSTSSSTDVFGNNSCWLFPASGAARGQALPFATGPMECELCGICFDQPGGGQGETTLFLAVQHPGEVNGTRRKGAEEIQAHQLVDRNGVGFAQLRTVPLGSNWPSGVPGRSPRPGIVAIHRANGAPLVGA